jgi:hypothetical protein
MMIRPFQKYYDFQNTICAHNFWKQSSFASTNPTFHYLHPPIHLFIKHTMLTQLGGKDNKTRVDLLKGCHAIWLKHKDKRATYAMAENTTSIVNVKFDRKYLTHFISLIIFVLHKFYIFNNFCNSKFFSHTLS